MPDIVTYAPRALTVPRARPSDAPLICAVQLTERGLLDVLHPDALIPDVLVHWATGWSRAGDVLPVRLTGCPIDLDVPCRTMFSWPIPCARVDHRFEPWVDWTWRLATMALALRYEPDHRDSLDADDRSFHTGTPSTSPVAGSVAVAAPGHQLSGHDALRNPRRRPAAPPQGRLSVESRPAG